MRSGTPPYTHMRGVTRTPGEPITAATDSRTLSRTALA